MTDQSMSRAWRNLAVLVAAQAVLGSQITMLFTIGSLVGKSLSPTACLATLPITMIVLGSTLTAPWLSTLMQRAGRRIGFWVGALGGLLGAATAAFGMMQGSFVIFLVGSLLTGIYMSAQGFYRFAATDTAPDAFKPKAISYVLAGGLISALIGPQLVKVTYDMFAVPFLGSYLVAMGINLIGMAVIAFLDIPKPEKVDASQPQGRSVIELLRTPKIAVAIICAMVSYSLMNLVMTSTPLAVVGCGFGEAAASDVVSAHVIAMFLPSFFTGHLIARFGAEKIIAAGLVILAGAGAVGLTGVNLSQFFVTLVLLGVGWNFGFIGATTMLASAHTPAERGRVQGLNDMIVFGSVMLASLASGGLMNCSGGSVEDGWASVNMAMGPFLMLAGLALIWLWRHPSRGDKVSG